LWDNLSLEATLKIAADLEATQPLADRLADACTANSLNKSYVSPFQLAATKAGVKWQGGKVDDVTIVCLTVVDNPDLQPTTLLSTMPEKEGLSVQES
jgi:protein phosphatase PTC7